MHAFRLFSVGIENADDLIADLRQTLEAGEQHSGGSRSSAAGFGQDSHALTGRKGDRMMKYDFDQIIDRRGTSCLKYDFAVERGKREDVLPLWVADMDFRVAEPILKRLHACVDHGIFGYSEAKDDYFQVVAGWISENLG